MLSRIDPRWIDDAAFDIHAGLPRTRRLDERMELLIDHRLNVTRTQPIAEARDR